MSRVRPTGAWDGTRFAHEGFVYGTDHELVHRVVPFVLEGFSRDEPVLVVAGERVRSLLAAHLGPDLGRLALFAAAETWYQGGARTLQAYDRDLRGLRATTPHWRLAAEPVWLAAEDGREWSRFESVANRCYDDMPYYSLCLHDRRRLPADVLDAVARTHPLTWGEGTPVPAAEYEEPGVFLRSVQPAWAPRPAGAEVLVVTSPWSARRQTCALVPDDRRARVGDVVLATHELLLNSLTVAPYAELTTWMEGDVFVVEVSDSGPGLPDETRGYVPPDPGDGPHGMWLAWSLADDAAVRSGPDGTAIRLYFGP
ncbi:anti-sigma factor RsbA family regulatory protein [Trujillonella endophytica]|uniref:MEDS: MEthanogen/methylotroph, DcmR Sensory domain n=1 Tax=Trujillonella endophytica TaxID=673521 RepID=A0A1H8PYJ1_9ACTN|nr:anti-sigma factor RsbA family regulatory protein [Trujillella endophytica]SEO47000.1 MEDS: MEthanogen/methylotroph, DcmR Sensory domain [Trujillella endophytica]